MNFRTRLIGCCVICLLGMAGCNPGPDNPGADVANNTNNPDAGTDIGSPDSADPDGGDDGGQTFSFDGLDPLDPLVVSAEAPETVKLTLATTGEMPDDALVDVTVGGEAVELGDDMTFTPPSRDGMPGSTRVEVTIGATTHQTELRYGIDPEALQLDDARESIELPGTVRATAVWTADTDEDGDLEYLVYDDSHSDESMDMLRVYEEKDDGTLESKARVEIPPTHHEMDKATPVDLDGDGDDDAISLTFVARASSVDAGARVLETRLHKGQLTQLEEVHVFDPTETVLDVMTKGRLDPDTGTFMTSIDALVVNQNGEDLLLRKRPGRAASYEPLGLTEYSAEMLLDGTERVLLCPDETGGRADAIIGMDVDPDTGAGEILWAPATDYNSSRSNTTSSIIAPGGGGDCDDGDADVKPGLDARIMDVDGDGISDLVVANGCPGDVDVHIARGRDVETATGTERRYAGPMKLLEDQTTPKLIHTLSRSESGMLTGISTGRCDEDRCEPSFVFELPADALGSGTLDDVTTAAIPPGNPLYEGEGLSGTNPMYEGKRSSSEERFSFKPERVEDAVAPPPPNGNGSWWLPADDRLRSSSASGPSSTDDVTHIRDLRDSIDVDVAETLDATLAVAAIRGPVTLRNADQAKVDGGALIRPAAPRIFVARCESSVAEEAAGARSWKGQRCSSGIEVEELQPPRDCVWNGRVSLNRAADGSHIDAYVGIAREEYKKKRVYRFTSSEALSEGSDEGTVSFPGAEGEVIMAGTRAFSMDATGELVTGETMGNGALLTEVRMQSTGVFTDVRAELGEAASIVGAVPLPVNGSDDYGVIVNVEHEGSGPFVVAWNPDRSVEGENGDTSWWGHCNGWTTGVTDETSNGRFEATLSSFDAENSSVIHELVVGRGDETFRVRATSDGRMDDRCGEPLLGGTWPDEHICPSTGERCRGGILSSGDVDGDGFADIVLATEEGPVLYSDVTSASPQRVGPIRWMAPERHHEGYGGAGGQIVVKADGTFAVAPPQFTFLDGILSPYLP